MEQNQKPPPDDTLGVQVGPNSTPAGAVPGGPQPRSNALGMGPDGKAHLVEAQDAAPQPAPVAPNWREPLPQQPRTSGENLPEAIGHADIARRGERYGQNWGAKP